MIVAAASFFTWNVLISISASGSEQPLIASIEVQYVGPKLVAESRVLSQMSTKPGRRFSPRQLDEDIRSLYASGEIKNVRVLSEKTSASKVKLIVVVECAPLNGGVGFSGNTAVPAWRLSRLVDLENNEPIGEASLHQTTQQIRELYRKKGYPNAMINARVGAPNSRGYSVITFEIDEQRPGILRKVRFSGNSALSDAELKEVMLQKESGVKTILKTGGRTDLDSITEDVRAIENLYRNRGYFQARVIDVSKVPAGSRRHDLVISIEEGTAHKVSRITIDGVNALSLEKDLAPYLKTQAGQKFSAEDLEADIEMITKLYRSRGYIDARVTPRIESAD